MKENNLMTFLTGRAALQKRIMALLRKIEHCVNGVQPVSTDLFI
jgi:neurofibromin 1